MSKVDHYTGIEDRKPFSITRYPELVCAAEITPLLSSLGEVVDVGTHGRFFDWMAHVKVKLHKPAVVHNWAEDGPHPGVSINEATSKVMRYPASIKLPKSGDEYVELTLEFQLDTRFDELLVCHNADILRGQIRAMAQRMAEEGFLYHFKEKRERKSPVIGTNCQSCGRHHSLEHIHSTE